MLGRPGQSQELIYKHSRNLVSKWVTPFLVCVYGPALPSPNGRRRRKESFRMQYGRKNKDQFLIF